MSTSEPLFFAGVDVGAARIDAALLRVSGGRCHVESLFTGPVGSLIGFCSRAVRVGIDAPGGLSAGAHLADLSVATKFRSGRCSEIPVPGVPPVPWVTPMAATAAPGWMLTGFEVWAALGSAGFERVETFPAAVFHRLNGGRWPPRKTTPAGLAARLSLLGAVVDLPSGSVDWTHDQVDAVACAVVAAMGRLVPHACACPDGSAMWGLA